MRTNELQDEPIEEPNYEVGQEQLDAVDRMLEELGMDEEFGRVPSAFTIVERFQQQQQLQQQLSNASTSDHTLNTLNGHDGQSSTGWNQLDSDDGGDQMDSDNDDDNDSPEPFGYIPLDQGFENDNDGDEEDDDEDSNRSGDVGFEQMQSDDEDEDEGQGYDGYLRSANREGELPVPVIPSPVQIDLNENTEQTIEQIPEEDLKTIALVMNSFSLPAPDWAKSIPEERWLPRIVQQVGDTLSDKDEQQSE
ncbi:hypothetical protein BGZ76_009026 [Entomortierella beljakovae]|nr:hypothetical protein BGZ76_009026 [Entomortierella beljakovae]